VKKETRVPDGACMMPGAQRIPALVCCLVFLAALLLPLPCRAEEAGGTLTLSEGLKIATENNRLIRIALREKEMAGDDTLFAQSRYLPLVNASVSQTFLANQPGALFGPTAVRTADRSSFAYGVEVRQTLYDFGARKSLYEASKSAFNAAGLNTERVRNLVALDFIATYLDLLETGRMEQVAQREVESLEAHRKTARDLYQEGVITKNDLLQAEVKLSDAQQRLLTVRNGRTVMAARLNSILSRPLNGPVNPVDVPVDPGPDPAPALEKAWEIAEKQRSELRIVDRELESLSLAEKAKQADYFPKFFAQAGYSYAENRYMLHEDNFAFVLGMNMNLFSGGSTKAEVSKIRHQRERLLEQRRKLVEDIRLEVEKNFVDKKNASERLKAAGDAVGQAEENLKINKVRYEEGIGTATDVLDAIALLTTAETNYYRASYELRRAGAGYRYAMGLDLAAQYK